MENNQSYKTAYVTAYARLVEQYQPEESRLFEDSIVQCFFGKLIRFLLQFKQIRNLLIFMYNIPLVGMMGSQVCRTKYIDDRLQEAISNGIEQLVILGAGFDTRAYRISGIEKMSVYEVDLPILQERKQRILRNYLGEIPSNIIYAPIDFNVQSLDEVLAAKELDLSKPSIFIWEGVTPYITEDAVKNTLKFVSKASPGSILVFTYILKSVIDRSSNIIGVDFLLDSLETGEHAWILGFNPSEIENFIAQYHLTLQDDVGPSHYKERFLRPIGRNLNISEIERIVYAKVI